MDRSPVVSSVSGSISGYDSGSGSDGISRLINNKSLQGLVSSRAFFIVSDGGSNCSVCFSVRGGGFRVSASHSFLDRLGDSFCDCRASDCVGGTAGDSSGHRSRCICSAGSGCD